MLQSKLDPWGKGHPHETSHGKEAGSKGQAAGLSGSANTPGHARVAQSPAEAAAGETSNTNVAAPHDPEGAAARKEASTKLLPHVDGPGRHARRPQPASPMRGGVAPPSPSTLKSSLKAGTPRTVRATGRPANIEPLAVHPPLRAPPLPSRSLSPDLMPPRLANADSGGPATALSLPVLPRLPLAAVPEVDDATSAAGTPTAAAPPIVPGAAPTLFNPTARGSSNPNLTLPSQQPQSMPPSRDTSGPMSGAGIDRAGGSAPAFSNGAQIPNSPARLAFPFMGGVGSSSMRNSRSGALPFPMHMLPNFSNPNSPMRGGKKGSPGKSRIRRPKRPGGQQQGSARLNMSKGGRHVPDPSGPFEVVTTAPGVIGEVSFSPEIWCMDLWEVLQGGCNQQRAWTFGSPAISNAAAAAAEILAAAGGVQAADAGAAGAPPGPTASGDAGITYTSPQPLALLNGVVFRQAAAGSHHGAAVSSDGYLYVWGSDSRGQLGRGWPATQHIAAHPMPLEVQLPIEASLDDVQGQLPATLLQGIMASNEPKSQSTFLADCDAEATGAAGGGEGEAPYARAGPIQLFPMPEVHPSTPSGDRSASRIQSVSGALADGKGVSLAAAITLSDAVGPGPVAAAVAAAAAAAAASAVVNGSGGGEGLGDEDGEDGGRKAKGPRVAIINEQLHVYRLKLGVPVRMVACGALHTLAAIEGGGVMGWGDNASGQATGKAGSPAARVMAPTRITVFEHVEVICVSAGLQHSSAVTSSGAVWSWGSNRHGRLGIGVAAPASLISSPTVSPGRPLFAAAACDRDLLPNTAAMLAFAHHTPDGVHDDVKQGLTHLPKPVPMPGGIRVRTVACGYRHSLALATDGSVWAWGSNAKQALGLADFSDWAAPVRVPGLGTCTAVSASSISAAISREGYLYLWGSDSYLNPWVHRNRVGGPQGTAMTPRSASLPVIHRVRWLGCHRFRSVSVGARHAVAVSTHSRMYWWGDDDILPGAMQYGAARLAVKPPDPSDFLVIPLQQPVGDGSVPPPPPPPLDPRLPVTYYGSSNTIPNRLSAFRLFSARTAMRPSVGVRGVASSSLNVSASGGSATTGYGYTGPDSSWTPQSMFAGGHHPRDDMDRYGLTVKLGTFNDVVYVCIRARRPTTPAGLGGSFLLPFPSRPSSVMGGPRGAAGSVPMSPEASLAVGAGASVLGRSGSPPGPAGGPAGALVSGDEQVVLVACGEGHTVCLCGETRYNVTIDETRNAMMLALRQYARHWHAVRHGAQARLGGGSPSRVRARSTDKRPSSGRSTRSLYGVGRSGPVPSVQDIYRDPFPYIELDERPLDPRDELCSLDMLLVFCRQAGLIDNISEYNDVIELYRVQLTNKHARIPPSMKHAVEMAGGCDTSNNPTGAINMLPVRLHTPVPELILGRKHTSEQDSRPGGRVGFGSVAAPSAAAAHGGSGGGAGFPQFPKGSGFGAANRLLGLTMGGSQPTTPMGGRAGGVLMLGGEASQALMTEESMGSGSAGGAAGGGGSGGRSVPGTPPSLRIVDMRSYMPRGDRDESSGPDERLQDADVLDLLVALMQNRQLVSTSSKHLPVPALLKQLAVNHFMKLKQTACAAPLPWVLGQVIRTEMLRALDSGPNSLTLHQAYIFLTSEHSAPQDLHLSMQDMRLGLAQVEQPFTVPLLRLAQFIRQSGLLPRLLSRILTHLHKTAEYYLDRLAVADQVPWWWPVEVLHTRRAAVSAVGVSPTLYQRPDVFAMWQMPIHNNLLGLETIAGVVYDFDILGVYYGTTRKALRNQLTSEEQLALEHAKRDRLLAYVLSSIMGQYLIPLERPWDMRPDNVLNHAVSYPQFVEILAACLSLKAATQTPTGAVLSSVQLMPTLGDTLQHLPSMLESVGLWREKILYPWKFNRVKHNDLELQRQVDRAFSLYCTIDPLAQTLGINIYQFTQLVRDTDVADKTLTMERIQEVFAAVAMVRVRNVPALRTRAAAARQDDNMEWTGLTAAQIIRLSTSQFAYTVAQHKLEEHVNLREKAMTAWKPREFGGGPGGGTSGTVSLALALREAAQRTAEEVDDAEAGIVRPGAQRNAWPTPNTSQAPGRSVSSSGGVLNFATAGAAASLARPSAPTDYGAPTLTAATTSPLSSPSIQQLRANNTAVAGIPNASPNTTAAAIAGASIFVSKLRRPGARRTGRPRDLAGLLRNRRQSGGLVSFAVTVDESDMALVRGNSSTFNGAAISQDGSYALLNTSTGDGGLGLNDITGGGSMLAAEDELDLHLSWPSFTTEQFADSDQDTGSGMSAAEGVGSGSHLQAISRQTSPLRHSFSPHGPRRRGDRSPGADEDEGIMVSMSGLPHPELDALAFPANMAADPSDMQRTEDLFRSFGTPDGPLPPPPSPPPMTADSDRGRGSSLGRSHSRRLSRDLSRHTMDSMTSELQQDPQQQQLLPEGEEAAGAAGGGAASDRPVSRLWSERKRNESNTGMSVAFGSGTPRKTFLDEAMEQALAADRARLEARRREDRRGRSPGRSHLSRGDRGGGDEHMLGPTSSTEWSHSSSSSPERGPRAYNRLPASPLGPNRGWHLPTSYNSRTSIGSPLLDGIGESLGSPPRSPHLPRPESAASSVIGSVNRLVLTKHALVTTGGSKSAKKLHAQPGKLLTREQFSEVIQRLAVVKYSKISSPMAAWRLLIERHVLPVVETRSTKFDRYLEEMMGPSIMSLVLAWEPQLKALFRIYGKDELKQTTGRGMVGPTTTASVRGSPSRSHSRRRSVSTPHEHPSRNPSRPTTARSGGRSPKSVAGDQRTSAGSSPSSLAAAGRTTMSFVQFLQLCQDRKIIPALIQPAGLEEIFRRVNFMDGVESFIRNMGYPQFVDAVCLTAMTIYHHPRYKEQAMTVEDMLETFFSQLCALKRARTRPNHMGGLDGAAAAAAAAAVRGAGAVENPYAQWWSLRFDPPPPLDASGHAVGWSYLSSTNYAPILIQDLVVPPPPVPEAVTILLARAAELHNRGDCPAALGEYDKAAVIWRAMLSDEGNLPFGGALTLSPEQEIYLCLIRASVLVSCGRDNAALLQYEAAEQQLWRLPEGHSAEPLIHGCRGHLLYHMGRLQDAFERMVQAKVLREQHPDMGSHHVDTALAHHNLACCLDRLGKTHMALRLLSGATETFRVVLGIGHPRTLTASRNMGHMEHRLFKLDLRYRSVAQEQADAEHAAVVEALHRAAGRGPRNRRPGVDSVYTLTAPRLVLRREQANAALAAAAAATAMLAPRRLQPLRMPAKDRLAAFQLRVHGATSVPGTTAAAIAAAGGVGGGSTSSGDGDQPVPRTPPGVVLGSQSYTRGHNGVKYYRSKHDMDYLGGGMHRAHPDVMATYEALKADIAAHASGAVHARVPEGVVVVQRGAALQGRDPTSLRRIAAAAGARPGGGGGGGGGGPARQAAAEEIPGPLRAFRGGVYDRTLAARKLKVERRYGLVQPPAAPAPPAVETVMSGRERSLQLRRANVLAAAMLEELNARLTGYGAERSATVVDRLADVLTGSAGQPLRSKSTGRGGGGGGGRNGEPSRVMMDDGETSSRRSARSRPGSP